MRDHTRRRESVFQLRRGHHMRMGMPSVGSTRGRMRMGMEIFRPSRRLPLHVCRQLLATRAPPAVNEFRHNLATDEWVLLSAARRSRPFQISSEPSNDSLKVSRLVDHDENCPFCRGNEHLTPPTVLREPAHAQRQARASSRARLQQSSRAPWFLLSRSALGRSPALATTR